MKHISEFLEEGLHEMFEERAGILEFCAGIPRHQAEEQARRECDELNRRREAVDADKVQK